MRYPPFPQVGVGAVVLRNNDILLIRRINDPGKGKWSVPGGHLELGESIYSAATRELYEETGIKGEPLGIINIDEYVEIEDKVKYHYVLIDVLIKPNTPLEDAAPGGDVDRVGLYNFKEALNLDLTRSTRSLIMKLMKGIQIFKSNFIVIRKEE